MVDKNRQIFGAVHSVHPHGFYGELGDYFHGYRGRYSQYWSMRWGMIPQLATSFDNSNDVYELLAWLQRGFKMLLDDFANLELEFEEFKNAITEMLEVLIPELIIKFVHSKEFQEIIKEIIWNWWNENKETIIKEIVDGLKIDEKLKEIWDKINEILEILSKFPKDMTTQFMKVLWKATSSNNSMQSGDVFQVEESIFNYDTIMIQYAVGGSQYSTQLTPAFLDYRQQQVPNFSGMDFVSNVKFEGVAGLKCTDSTGINIKVVPENCRLIQYDFSKNGAVVAYLKGNETKNKTGSIAIQSITGVKSVKVW